MSENQKSDLEKAKELLERTVRNPAITEQFSGDTTSRAIDRQTKVLSAIGVVLAEILDNQKED